MKPALLHTNIVDPPAGWDDKLALTTASTRLTYGEVRDKVATFGAWLRENGCAPGDRVALYLPRCAEGIIAAYAVLASGAAFAAIDTEAPPQGAAKIIRFAEPQRVLTITRFAERLRGLPDFADLPPITELPEACRGGGLDGFTPSCADPAPVVPPDATAVIFFTSGSTGTPKGVELTHRSVLSNIECAVRTFAITCGDRFALFPPLHFGLAEIPLFATFYSGASIYVLNDAEIRFPADITRAVEKERITVWFSVPTATRHLIDRGSLDRRDLSALRYFFCGGEPFLVTDLRRLMRVLPGPEYIPTYGITEAGWVAYHRMRAVPAEGDLAIPLGMTCDHLELSLRDIDGNEVADGEVGEICLVGARIMSGYWCDPARTAAARLAGRSDSFRSGDFARRDGDGLLHFCGRSDRRMKLRGYGIDLLDVEAVLRSAAGADEAIALVLSDPTSGDDRLVGVVRGAGVASDIATAARQRCRDALAAYARPDRILVCAEYPRLPSGKVDRRALEAWAEADLSDSAKGT